MKRLSQFLYKVLLTTLAGILISISTFPGEVIALDFEALDFNPSKIAPQFREQARQKEAQLRGPTENQPDANGCPEPDPNNPQPEFPNLNFINISDSSSSNTLFANSADFSIGKATFNDKQRVALYEFTQENISGEPSGQYMPPVFKVAPGDTIDLTLNNQLTNPAKDSDTNLHYHGFNVSPEKGSDDVLIRVGPGTNGANNPYHMAVRIPKNHQPGLFWYHPHVHDDSDSQVLGGMSGGIIVEGIENYYDIINGIPLKPDGSRPKLTERVLLFKDLNLKDTNKTRYSCYTLNGLVNPKITIKPGEVQFWRIGNIGADIYMNLSLVKTTTLSDPKKTVKKTRVPFYILARDGNVVLKPIQQYQILLPPANRVEVLIGDLQRERLLGESIQYNL